MELHQAVTVLLADGQLGALAWAFAQEAPGARLGAIALRGPGELDEHAEPIAALHAAGLLAGFLTAAEPEHAGGAPALAGALATALGALSWDAAVCLCGQAPIAEGRGALLCAQLAEEMGAQTLAVAEMSTAGGPHKQLSERTLSLLDLLSEPVTVALPAGIRSPVGRELREGLRSVFDSQSRESQLALGVDRPARIARHDWRRSPIDLIAFVAARVPAPAGAPSLFEDPLLFASALAAGGVLAQMLDEQECP